MAYIDLPEGLPGIRGPMAFRQETAKPMNELVSRFGVPKLQFNRRTDEQGMINFHRTVSRF